MTEVIKIDQNHWYRWDGGETIEFCVLREPHTCEVTRLDPLVAMRKGSLLVQMASMAIETHLKLSGSNGR